MSVEALILNVRRRFAEQDGPALGAFFRPLDLPHVAALRNAIQVSLTLALARSLAHALSKTQSRPSDALEKLVVSRFGEPMNREATLVTSFLEYCRTADPSATDSASRLRDYDALATVYR